MIKAFSTLIFSLVWWCLLQGSASSYQFQNDTVPTYTVNLDLPPRQRWVALIKKYDRKMIMDGIEKVLERVEERAFLRKIVVEVCSDLEHFIPQPYADELRGIADALDCDIGVPVLVNLFYEIVAHKNGGSRACTSIVTMDKKGSIIHGRNFDFNFSDFLRNLTVNVIFQKNGKTLYYGTSYVLMLGPATLVKPGLFSLSFNERDTGSWLLNVISALKEAWPISMYARQVMENATSFDDAIENLKKAKTIAPFYAIVGGVKPYQGALLIGDRWGMKVEYMNDFLQHRWYVVETNYDPWNNPPKTDDRRDAAIASMNSIGQGNMDVQQLYSKVLSIPPVLNVGTVFTTIMSASDDSIFHTVVRHPEH